MRTHNQLLDAIIAAWPTKEEVAQLNLAQIETLRGATNCLDNVLFLATPKGRELVEEARAAKARGNRHEDTCGCSVCAASRGER